MAITESLADELVALEAIYPGCVVPVQGSNSTFSVSGPDAPDDKLFYLTFDRDYPRSTPSVAVIKDTISKAEIEALLSDSAGSEVLYSVISALEGRERAETVSQDIFECQAAPVHVHWHVGEPVTDRKSTMLGRACQVQCQQDVEDALQAVLMDKQLQKASHPQIWAYKYTDSEGRQVHDSNDDGESGAAVKLAFLLDVTEANNVMLIVTRWFGGVLLGDIRFKHIVTAGRSALEVGGFINKKN